MLDDEPRPKGVVFSIPNRSLTVAARCVCAHDEPSTINGGAARLALQTRNVVFRIVAGGAETQKKFFAGTIFHFKGVARLALQTRSALAGPIAPLPAIPAAIGGAVCAAPRSFRTR